MARDKRSFFERLTGSVHLDEDAFDDRETSLSPLQPKKEWKEETHKDWNAEESTEGQLSVDVYHTPSEIIIKTIVAGVRPEDLDISITRDMVTIRGKREEVKDISTDQYFHKELYWGSFSRTIVLPEEIEVEDAEAESKHGLLTIKLPKINKERQTKLRVRTTS